MSAEKRLAALVGAPLAGAAGGLLNDVTAPLGRTAQSSDTSATGGLAPVVQTVANAAAPATSAAAATSLIPPQR